MSDAGFEISDEFNATEVVMAQFVQLHNAVARDPRLTSNSFRVYVNLRSHARTFRVSYGLIQAQTGLGVKAVRNAMEQLEELGYLRRTRTRQPNGRLGGYRFAMNDFAALAASPVDNSTGGTSPAPQCREGTVDLSSGNVVGSTSGQECREGTVDLSRGNDANAHVGSTVPSEHSGSAHPPKKTISKEEQDQEEQQTPVVASGDQPHLPLLLASGIGDSTRDGGRTGGAALNVYVRGRLPECPRCERPYSALSDAVTCRTCREEIAAQARSLSDWEAA